MTRRSVAKIAVLEFVSLEPGCAAGYRHTEWVARSYRALQPFGQVPILEEDGFVLFESGAIVLYIGERSEALRPKDVGARARARNG